MKYLFGVLGVILLLILAFVFIFNRGDDGDSAARNTPALLEYANKNSTVSHTTYGPLVGEEERRAVRVVVTPNERRVEILSGYDENVVDSRTYANTQSAYENLLSGLSLAGFISKKATNVKDERGVCPTGNRYQYVLREDGRPVNETWSVSCNNNGSFAGSASQVRNLFQAQIPDYRDITRDIEL